MNLTGKILIVLNFVAVCVFMVLLAVVHQTHVAWRGMVTRTQADPAKELPLGLEKQLEQADDQIRKLKGDHREAKARLDRLERDYSLPLAQVRSRLAAVERDKSTLEAKNAQVKERIGTTQKELDNIVDLLSRSNEELNRLRALNTGLIHDRDQAITRERDLAGQLAQSRIDYEETVQENENGKLRIGQYALVFQDLGIQLDRLDEFTGPPQMNGFVTAALENELVEISRGFDDGLEVGDKVDVYRVGRTLDTTRYLGEIKIVRTEKSRSVGRILAGFKGKIQRGDRIATGL